MSFNNKVILVTGASSGIGAAIAIKFASEGGNVAIVGRNENKIKGVSQKCEEAGGKVLVIIGDVSKDKDVQRVLNETISRFGRLDVLVNNAGIAQSSSITGEKAMQVFDLVMNTNLRSAVYLTNLAVPHLIKTKGNIINISSVAGMYVMGDRSFAYGVSKAGLDHFMRNIAFELAPKGVRVNNINPGPVKTDIIGNVGVSTEIEKAAWERMKKGTALDRISEPEEIADLVLFIASDKAKGITGSCFVSDNGCLLKGDKI